MHEVHYGFCFLVVVLGLYLFEEFEIFCLILQRVVFYEPKLPFSINFWKIKLRKLFLFKFHTPTNIRAMLKSLTQQRFHNSRHINIRKYKRTCLQRSLKWRHQNNLRIQILQFLACLSTLHHNFHTSNLPFWDRWQSICFGL